MMDKPNRLGPVFHWLFVGFCLLITALTIEQMAGKYELDWPFAAIAIVVAIGFGLLLSLKNSLSIKDARYLPLYIFLFSLLLRLSTLLLMGQDVEQISDFHEAFRSATQLDNPTQYDIHYNRYPNWYMPVAYLRLLAGIFGSSQHVPLVFNAVLASCSSALIYIIVRRTAGSDSMGALAALLYSCIPSQLAYGIIINPEPVNVFLMLAAIWLLQRDTGGNVKRSLAIHGAAGLVLAMAGFFKSIDKIFIIAYACACLVYTGFKGRKPKRLGWKAVLGSRAALIAVMAVVNLLTGSVVHAHIARVTGRPVNGHASAYYLYMGLSAKSYNGGWTQEAVSTYVNILDANQEDYDVAARLIMQELRREAEENQHLDFEYFQTKLERGWTSTDYISFANDTMGEGNSLSKDKWLRDAMPLCDLYYFVLLLLMLAGAVGCLRNGGGKLFTLCGLMIFGYALALLFIETQARYKVVVYPYMCILSAYGGHTLFTKYRSDA